MANPYGPKGKYNQYFTDPVKTGIWFSNFLKEHNLLEHEIAKFLGVSDQRVCNWAKGVRGMRLATIFALYYVGDISNCDRPYSVMDSIARKTFEDLRG